MHKMNQLINRNLYMKNIDIREQPEKQNIEQNKGLQAIFLKLKITAYAHKRNHICSNTQPHHRTSCYQVCVDKIIYPQGYPQPSRHFFSLGEKHGEGTF